jgi:hypothetical protein
MFNREVICWNQSEIADPIALINNLPDNDEMLGGFPKFQNIK